jgi:polysaccharide biosynthesis protein PslH
MIVYITPKPPYPLTGGMEIRQFHLLRAYAERGAVHLVTFYEDERQREAAERLTAYCERVHAVSTRTMRGEQFAHESSSRKVMRRLRGYRPTVVSWSYSAEMTSVIEELATNADVVHVGRLHMASQTEGLLASAGRRPEMVLDLDDVEVSYRRRQLRYGPREHLRRRLYGYYDLLRLWAYQTSTMRRFDRVFVCSERDRRRLARANVVVVPNGTSVPASPPAHHTDGRTILFCGQLSYGPNVDGLRFFVRSVFPHIRRAVPDARLVIVGRAPAPDVRALHDGKSVVVVGEVPGVTEYYAGATMAVVPLRFGGGTRIKILEAWAHGVPVVSTTIGCEGLEGVSGRHLIVADRAVDFARRCITVLRSPDLRERLAREAWRLVSEAYRWDDIGRRAVSDIASLRPASTGAGETIINQSAASDAGMRRGG